MKSVSRLFQSCYLVSLGSSVTELLTKRGEMGICIDKSDAVRENGNKRNGQSITDFNEEKGGGRPFPLLLLAF